MKRKIIPLPVLLIALVLGIGLGMALKKRKDAAAALTALNAKLSVTDQAVAAELERTWTGDPLFVEKSPDYGKAHSAYAEYKALLRQAFEEGWDWDYLSMRADYYIDEGLPIIAALESGGDPETCDAAVNEAANAVGRYQITPIMIKEANRILGEEKFKLEDRSNRIASGMIARTYLKYWMPRRFGDDFQPQHIAILWHGGSDARRWGVKTEAYAKRFMECWVSVHGDEE